MSTAETVVVRFRPMYNDLVGAFVNGICVAEYAPLGKTYVVHRRTLQGTRVVSSTIVSSKAKAREVARTFALLGRADEAAIPRQDGGSHQPL